MGIFKRNEKKNKYTVEGGLAFHLHFIVRQLFGGIKMSVISIHLDTHQSKRQAHDTHNPRQACI